MTHDDPRAGDPDEADRSAETADEEQVGFDFASPRWREDAEQTQGEVEKGRRFQASPPRPGDAAIMHDEDTADGTPGTDEEGGTAA